MSQQQTFSPRSFILGSLQTYLTNHADGWLGQGIQMVFCGHGACIAFSDGDGERFQRRRRMAFQHDDFGCVFIETATAALGLL